MRDDLAKYILSTMPLLGRKLFKGMRNHKIHQDYHVLFMIHDCDGKPMKYYSEKLALSKSNFTKNINRLIELGYVKRVHDENDRRVIHIFVTDIGKNFVAERKLEVIKGLKERLSVLSNEQADELLLHLKGIERIINELEE